MPGSAIQSPVSKKIMFNFAKWLGKTYYFFDPELLKWTNLLDEKDTLTDAQLFEKFLSET